MKKRLEISNIKKNKKAQLEISFPWLFAIIAGIFILVLAIYISTKFIFIEQTQIDTETAKYIGILLNPFEIGAESGISTPMTTPTESKIYISCNENGNFGNQLISTSQKSFGWWSEQSVEVSFKNKYIFSEDDVEGKKFFLFIKPFNSPFKVGDIIILTSASKNYCFVDFTDGIKIDIENLGQENMKLEPDCLPNSIKVCFNENGISNSNCEINVFYSEGGGYVEKDGDKLYFIGDSRNLGLVYGAIFSNKELYECQVKRLMKRLNQLSVIYERKAVFISQRGCTNNLAVDLQNLASSSSVLSDSYSLNQLIYPKSTEIEEKNENNVFCKLW